MSTNEIEVPAVTRTESDRRSLSEAIALVLVQRARQIAGLVVMLAGGITILIGWLRLSSETRVQVQLSYIMSAGVAGVFLTGLGAALFLAGHVRQDQETLTAIEDDLEQFREEAERDRRMIAERLDRIERALADRESARTRRTRS